jgi:hypothetical protein
MIVPLLRALLLAALFAVPSASAAATPSCDAGLHLRPLAGKRLIVFGELHGTVEGPAFVARVLCSLAQRGDTLLLGLEIAATEQAVLDRYLRSAGTEEDRARLREMSLWNGDPRWYDGRASVAMFDLIDAARRLRAAGTKIEIAGFKPDFKPIEGEAPLARAARYEQEMAAHLTRATEPASGAIAVVLVGRAHASRRPFSDPGYPPMFTHLPGDDALNLTMAHADGTAWVLMDGVSMPRPMAARSCTPPSRPVEPIELGFAPPGFDGCYSVGPITAAPPARAMR